jgi:hypothetical protein
MGRRGPKPDQAKREAFARLIAEGVPSARACRIVGINPRTGKRWRNGRRLQSGGRVLGLAPVIITVAGPQATSLIVSNVPLRLLIRSGVATMARSRLTRVGPNSAGPLDVIVHRSVGSQERGRRVREPAGRSELSLPAKRASPAAAPAAQTASLRGAALVPNVAVEDEVEGA